MGFQAVALGGVALEPVGGVWAVFAARKGFAERLGSIWPAYSLKLIRIVKGGVLVSPVMNEHNNFLSESKKSRRMEALSRPGSPALRCFHYLILMTLKKGRHFTWTVPAWRQGLSAGSRRSVLLRPGECPQFDPGYRRGFSRPPASDCIRLQKYC